MGEKLKVPEVWHKFISVAWFDALSDEQKERLLASLNGEKPGLIEWQADRDRRLVEFEKELSALINKHCIESVGDIPDFMLAGYLVDQIRLLGETIDMRDMHNEVN